MSRKTGKKTGRLRKKNRSKNHNRVETANHNKNHNFTGKQIELLRALMSYNNVTGLSKITKRRKSNITASLQILARDGFCDNRHGKWYLTQNGLEILGNQNHNRVGRYPPQKDNGVVNKINLHDVCFSVYLLRKPRGWDRRRRSCFNLEVSEDLVSKKFSPGFGSGMTSLRFVDFTVQVFEGFLKVWVPGVIDTPENATRRVFNYLIGLLPKLEVRLSIPKGCLYRSGRVNVKWSSAHYARMDCEAAKWIVEHKGVREDFVVRGPRGERRLLVDCSEGFETEAVSAEFGESDIKKVDNFLSDLSEHEAVCFSDLVGMMGEMMKLFAVNSSVLFRAVQGIAEVQKGQLESVASLLGVSVDDLVKGKKKGGKESKDVDGYVGVAYR